MFKTLNLSCTLRHRSCFQTDSCRPECTLQPSRPLHSSRPSRVQCLMYIHDHYKKMFNNNFEEFNESFLCVDTFFP